MEFEYRSYRERMIVKKLKIIEREENCRENEKEKKKEKKKEGKWR